MTSNLSLVPASAHINAKARLPGLMVIAGRLWAMFAPRFNAHNRMDEAIEILRSPSAGPDMREWAERYLCGMEGPKDMGQFGGRR
jgi:hypothetical protein